MPETEPSIRLDGKVRGLGGDFLRAARLGWPPLLEGQRKVRMNVMLDAGLAAVLDAQPDKGAIVNEALRRVLAWMNGPSRGRSDLFHLGPY